VRFTCVLAVGTTFWVISLCLRCYFACSYRKSKCCAVCQSTPLWGWGHELALIMQSPRMDTSLVLDWSIIKMLNV